MGKHSLSCLRREQTSQVLQGGQLLTTDILGTGLKWSRFLLAKHPLTRGVCLLST
jgi:hypothetical protein